MINWPESLIREIAEKRCVIHAGAGLSCQSVNSRNERLPSWENLLRDLMVKTKILAKDAKLINEFIKEKRFLDAAEIIRVKGLSAEFNASINNIFIDGGFNPSDAHRSIVNISPKILTTTNYDTLLECTLNEVTGQNSYTLYDHTRDGLLNSIRSPSTILIKMHGCAKYPSDIILSRSDYFKLRKKYSSFFNIISSIYKLNTVLFIGCGIEDPDINLILESNSIQIDSDNPSYAMVGDKSYAAKLKDTIKSQYGIDLLMYTQSNQNDHSNFEPSLKKLEESVNDFRAKFVLS